MARTRGAGKSAGPVPLGDVIVTVGRGGVVSTVIERRSVTVRPSLRRPIRTREGAAGTTPPPAVGAGGTPRPAGVAPAPDELERTAARQPPVVRQTAHHGPLAIHDRHR